jgi:hypothetical protein
VVSGHAKRIDIRPGVELATFDLFGAHVERRAHRDADLREVGAAIALDARQAEVGHFHFAAAREHDIFGLDVAVDDAFVAGFGERGGDLPHNIERQLRCERAARADDFAEIAPWNILLSNEMDAVDLPDFVDLHDAAVDERGGGAGLMVKAADVIGVAGELRVEDFEGDLTAERELLGQIDLGHRAAAETAEDEEVFQRFANKVGHDRPK